MSDYFEFIKEYKNIYENTILAESLLEKASSVPELDLFENQMRKTVETMTNKLIKSYGISCDERLDLRRKIDLLYSSGVLDTDSKDNYHTMRMEGNPGSHAHDTMDTYSAKRYFDEKKVRDENAFKRLYVECNRFVYEYMTKTERESAKESTDVDPIVPSQSVEMVQAGETFDIGTRKMNIWLCLWIVISITTFANDIITRYFYTVKIDSSSYNNILIWNTVGFVVSLVICLGIEYVTSKREKIDVRLGKIINTDRDIYMSLYACVVIFIVGRGPSFVGNIVKIQLPIARSVDGNIIVFTVIVLMLDIIKSVRLKKYTAGYAYTELEKYKTYKVKGQVARYVVLLPFIFYLIRVKGVGRLASQIGWTDWFWQLRTACVVLMIVSALYGVYVLLKKKVVHLY